jgi:hypothetical protein
VVDCSEKVGTYSWNGTRYPSSPVSVELFAALALYPLLERGEFCRKVEPRRLSLSSILTRSCHFVPPLEPFDFPSDIQGKGGIAENPLGRPPLCDMAHRGVGIALPVWAGFLGPSETSLEIID